MAPADDASSSGGDGPGSFTAGSRDDRSRRVYVGNLAWKVGWQDLKDHMRSAGGNVIRADVFVDSSGRSRGCGVVEFETVEQAQFAIAKLTDTELKNRKIFVREDREEDTRTMNRRNDYRGGRGGYSRGGYRGRGRNDYHNNYRSYRQRNSGPRPTSDDHKDCQVFVANLAWKTSWQDLKDLFRDAGNVVRADVYQRDGMSRGCGTVLFSTPDEALNALNKFDKYEFGGRQITVRIDQGYDSPDYY